MKSKSANHGVVLVTVASLEPGEAIASSLLNERLVACVNLFPVTSLYLWQGKVNQDREYQLVIKTDLNKFTELATRIETLHNYEVPEIIALPVVTGSESYLGWIDESLAQQ
ncbi:divalent-cation tolerance protein CutA [Pleurocapsales cyanobacterium LEGE 10410]|nr:divalent-cation tolerance protein CutA [Pleurocapsales cyanobacterium LEGE 10410]